MAGIELTLFTGPHCRLCDQALDILAPCLGGADRLHKVDVTSSLELKKAYGLIIPVLRREDSGAELRWPFGEAEIRTFLQR